MLAAVGMVVSLGIQAFAQSGVKGVGVTSPIQIELDSDYIISKVNDPVTKKDKPAFIVSENAVFHFVSEYYSEADVIFYINEYEADQDKGSRNRVLKKVVKMGESITMLPEDVYDKGVKDGSAYKFTERCYSVRVCYGPNNQNTEDFYFGLVDEDTFEQIASSIDL